jgi:cytochrome d ubiquinol oxidase subunit I
MAGGALLLTVGAWRAHRRPTADAAAFAVLARLGAWMTLAGGAFTALTGDRLGKVITEVQPMKMAAAEALYETTAGAPFSVFAVGRPGATEPFFSLEIPRLLSILAAGSPGATVEGINDLQAQYAARYGAGSYIPMVPVAFWSFRAMIVIGMFAAALALTYLWVTRRGRTPDGSRRTTRWLLRAMPLVPVLPAAANTFGWIFTETARQPWLAFGISRVADGISPGLTGGEVLASLLAFATVYGVLAVVWLRLVLHLVRQPLDQPPVAEPAATHSPVPVY